MLICGFAHTKFCVHHVNPDRQALMFSSVYIDSFDGLFIRKFALVHTKKRKNLEYLLPVEVEHSQEPVLEGRGGKTEVGLGLPHQGTMGAGGDGSSGVGEERIPSVMIMAES